MSGRTVFSKPPDAASAPACTPTSSTAASDSLAALEEVALLLACSLAAVGGVLQTACAPRYPRQMRPAASVHACTLMICLGASGAFTTLDQMRSVASHGACNNTSSSAASSKRCNSSSLHGRPTKFLATDDLLSSLPTSAGHSKSKTRRAATIDACNPRKASVVSSVSSNRLRLPASASVALATGQKCRLS